MSLFNINQPNQQTGQLNQALNVSGGSEFRAQGRIYEFVERFNKGAGQNKLNADEIIGKLKEAGMINDETSSALTAEDLETITSVPKLVARALCKAIQDDPKRSHSITRPSKLRAETMTVRQLLESYDPTDYGAPIVRELQDRLGTAPNSSSRKPSVIVFNESGTVDIESSERLIREYMFGDPLAEYVTTSTGAKRTHLVGELPQQIVGIHPITRENLRSSGQGSDGFNWAICSLACKQMLYLAVETDELASDTDRIRLLTIYQMASNEESGLGLLQNAFPIAAVKFLELEQTGDLPSLKRIRTRSASSDQTDPASLAREGTQVRRGTRY
jgi:hypothetical protein